MPRRFHHGFWLAPLLVLLPLTVTRCATYSSAGFDDPDGFVQGDSSVEFDSGTNLLGDSSISSKDASSANDASSDAGDSSAPVDSGPDTSNTQGACPSGMTQIGEYATWSGKVNVHHTTGGPWSVDTDCSSGAGVNTVAYCQKFWPAVTQQVHLAAPSVEQKPFTAGGGTFPTCGGVYPLAGIDQFACCTP